jgi:hypothetical protein
VGEVVGTMVSFLEYLRCTLRRVPLFIGVRPGTVADLWKVFADAADVVAVLGARELRPPASADK